MDTKRKKREFVSRLFIATSLTRVCDLPIMQVPSFGGPVLVSGW